MYCGQNYNTMCEISPSEWSCGGLCDDSIGDSNSRPASSPKQTPQPTPSANIPNNPNYPTLKPTAQLGQVTPSPVYNPQNQKTPITPTYSVVINNKSSGGSDANPYYPGNSNLYPNNTYGSSPSVSSSNAPSGQLMILGGLALVILTCMCVGWAQARKECGAKDKQSIDDHTPPGGFQHQAAENSVSASRRSFSRTPHRGAHSGGHGGGQGHSGGHGHGAAHAPRRQSHSRHGQNKGGAHGHHAPGHRVHGHMYN